MNFLAEAFMPHNGFLLAAGCGAVEIIGHQREGRRQREGLGRQQDLASGRLAHALGRFQICAQARRVQHEDGRRDMIGQGGWGHGVWSLGARLCLINGP